MCVCFGHVGVGQTKRRLYENNERRRNMKMEIEMNDESTIESQRLGRRNKQ
jgi:hypothetical protein